MPGKKKSSKKDKDASSESGSTIKSKVVESGSADDSTQPTLSGGKGGGTKKKVRGQPDKSEKQALEPLRVPGEPQEGEEPKAGDVDTKAFPIVGIGASAGGLEALEDFFSKTPTDSGIAFVIVSHTDPGRASMLPQILQRGTRMPVVEVEEGTSVRPNTVYLPPSNRDLALEGEIFHLMELRKGALLRLPIDAFLKSLAESRKERAACVILSGTGTDGTQGLRIVKEKGGVVVVQSPESAKYEGMPESALGTGLADFVLAPVEMSKQLIDYFSHEVRIKIKQEDETRQSFMGTMSKIVTILGNRTGHDFSQYKKSTLVRRIQRRMSVTRLSNPDRYLAYLHRHPNEIDSLFQDLLIGVTSFFRDPEAFEYIKKEILPEMLTRSDVNQPFRVWIPGCATGEEAYSIVILLKECLEELEMRREIQVFGTDIDTAAIEKAREGSYPQNIAADVTADRVARFFKKENEHYDVRKEIREPVVFAVQNVLKDPPFSKLDLLVCRNLLIYLESKAQKKLIPLFHYSLRPGGVLFLGSSETVGDFTDLFSTVSKKWNLYRKMDVSPALQPGVEFPTGGKGLEALPVQVKFGKVSPEAKEPGIAQATERLLLEKHTPACAVVNRKGDINYIHGRTGKYLELSQGHASLNIIDLAREGLRFQISSCLRKVVATNEPVRQQGLRVKTNGGYQDVNLTVQPMGEPEFLKDMIVVLFEEVISSGGSEKASEHERAVDDVTSRIGDLERELAKVQANHRIALEELETSNEELKSVNEEMQSSNEELQSTNEELESSREELQSLNEELSTVNAELHDKINELSEAYDSITDVLNCTRVAILFVDRNLNVRRFTHEATKLVNLIESDIGRPLNHISTNLEYESLAGDIQQVLEDLVPLERELRTRDGHWYFSRVTPFRVHKNRIDGAVVTFINIDIQKEAQKQVEEMSQEDLRLIQKFAETVVTTVRGSAIVLDADLRVLAANPSFYRTFPITPQETEGKNFHKLGNGQWDVPKLREALHEIVANDGVLENFVVESNFPGVGLHRMILNGRKLNQGEVGRDRILLTIEDASGERKCEK